MQKSLPLSSIPTSTRRIGGQQFVSGRGFVRRRLLHDAMHCLTGKPRKRFNPSRVGECEVDVLETLQDKLVNGTHIDDLVFSPQLLADYRRILEVNNDDLRKKYANDLSLIMHTVELDGSVERQHKQWDANNHDIRKGPRGESSFVLNRALGKFEIKKFDLPTPAWKAMHSRSIETLKQDIALNGPFPVKNKGTGVSSLKNLILDRLLPIFQ